MELAEVATQDGLLLQGLVFEPGNAGAALIYVHGLGGDFYGSPKKVNAFASECLKRKIAFFIFNNRGSGLYSGVKKLDSKRPSGYRYVMAGKCFERFEDSILDIGAVVAEAKRRGYSRIALVGHSTGANKAVYYLSRKHDRAVKAAVLTGPVSDVPNIEAEAGRKYNALVKVAKRMVSGGKGDSLMSPKTPGWPISASRFLSLSVAGSAEDVFQYHFEAPGYRALKRMRAPVLAILGEKDEYATMPPEKILASYKTQNPKLETRIVRGALHSFAGMEKELARIVCAWAQNKLNP
ncbi:MAG: alpha/beta fold hydrolase [Candidatus Micrarchaeota archaeon]